MRRRLSVRLLLVLLLVLPSVPASSAFSDESLKDLSRLPHLHRHWLQRLDSGQNKRNRVTTSSPPPPLPSSSVATTTTTDATEESLEMMEEEKVVTTSSPTRDADAEGGGGKGGQPVIPVLTISEAKERLKSRRLKIRKKSPALKEGQQQQQQQYKRTEKDELFSHASKEEALEVKKHIQRMANATCAIPAVRLVYVHQQYETTPNVRYLPSCTWLHRCSDESGCCPGDSQYCAASHIETVSLPFFMLTISGPELKRTIARLTFENHTACECVGRNSDVMPRTEPFKEEPQPSRIEKRREKEETEETKGDSIKWKKLDENKRDGQQERKRFHGERRRGHQQQQPDGTSHGDAKRGSEDVVDVEPTTHSPDRFDLVHSGNTRKEEKTTKRTVHSRCRCPSGFTANNKCNEGHHRRDHHRERRVRQLQHRCSRLNRGLETFPRRDRRCIMDKKCEMPVCDYGRYITFVGRCPRRDEKHQPWLRFAS